MGHLAKTLTLIDIFTIFDANLKPTSWIISQILIDSRLKQAYYLRMKLISRYELKPTDRVPHESITLNSWSWRLSFSSSIFVIIIYSCLTAFQPTSCVLCLSLVFHITHLSVWLRLDIVFCLSWSSIATHIRLWPHQPPGFNVPWCRGEEGGRRHCRESVYSVDLPGLLYRLEDMPGGSKGLGTLSALLGLTRIVHSLQCFWSQSPWRPESIACPLAIVHPTVG
jgi:hypothetical protein